MDGDRPSNRVDQQRMMSHDRRRIFGYDRLIRPCSTFLQYVHYRGDLRWLTCHTLLLADPALPIRRFVMEQVRQDLGVDAPMLTICNGVDEQRLVQVAPGCRARRRAFRIFVRRQSQSAQTPASAGVPSQRAVAGSPQLRVRMGEPAPARVAANFALVTVHK